MNPPGMDVRWGAGSKVRVNVTISGFLLTV